MGGLKDGKEFSVLGAAICHTVRPLPTSLCSSYGGKSSGSSSGGGNGLIVESRQFSQFRHTYDIYVYTKYFLTF